MSEEIYEITVAVIALGLVAVGLGLWTLQRLRRRKEQILRELKHSPRLDADRAFNRIAMARREADIVARQGKDVGRAREQIADAQSALDRHDSARAYELANKAHDSLVDSFRAPTVGAPLLSADPVPSLARSASPVSARPAPTGTASPSPPAPVAPVPRNRMEAQFELRLLDAEVDEAKGRRPNEPATIAAIDLQTKAHVSFDQGQFADAFRYALKGRRGLGGKVEAIAPSPGTAPGNGGVAPVDPALAAEDAASAARCPSCGYPVTAADQFCRGCGVPRTPTACPKCGTPRAPSDTFCGSCGQRFS